MKFEIETYPNNTNSTINKHPDSSSGEPFNFSQIHSSHEYMPFYALHNGPVKAKNIQLVEEEIRILENRIEKLKHQLYNLQHTD